MFSVGIGVLISSIYHVLCSVYSVFFNLSRSLCISHPLSPSRYPSLPLSSHRPFHPTLFLPTLVSSPSSFSTLFMLFISYLTDSLPLMPLHFLGRHKRFTSLGVVRNILSNVLSLILLISHVSNVYLLS